MKFFRQTLHALTSFFLATSLLASVILTLLFFIPGVVEPDYESFSCPSMFEMSKEINNNFETFYEVTQKYNKFEIYFGPETDVTERSVKSKEYFEELPTLRENLKNDSTLQQDKKYRAQYCRYETSSSISYYSPIAIVLAWAIALLFLISWWISKSQMKKKSIAIDVRARYIMETSCALVFLFLSFTSFMYVADGDPNGGKCSISDAFSLKESATLVATTEYYAVITLEALPVEFKLENERALNRESTQEQIDEANAILKEIQPEIESTIKEYKKTEEFKTISNVENGSSFDCHSYARQSVIIFSSTLLIIGGRWLAIYNAYRKNKNAKLIVK